MGMFGGGGADRAQREAKQAEQQRQAQIAQTTGQINQIYDAPERQKQYADFVSAVRQRYTDDANRQKGVATRQLKFANARAGLNGGTQEVDSRRTLGEEYQRGLLEAENRAQGSLADLRNRDEESRLQLTGLAQSGLDATTAAQRAGAALRTNTGAARDASGLRGLGDIFGGTVDTYKKQQDAANFRRGQQAPLGGLYTGGFAAGFGGR